MTHLRQSNSHGTEQHAGVKIFGATGGCSVTNQMGRRAMGGGMAFAGNLAYGLSIVFVIATMVEAESAAPPKTLPAALPKPVPAASPAFVAPALSACMQRMSATKKMYFPSDARAICKDHPSEVTQSCIVEIVTKAEGKLRNSDLLEVAALCKVDSSPAVRECVLRGLVPKFNDPKYTGVRVVGGTCLLQEKRKKTS